MRAVLVRFHRAAGLSLALFLAFAGLTGSAIVFNEELDARLNPALFETHTTGSPLSPSELARKVQRALPLARVTFIPLANKEGEAVVLRVAGRGAQALPYDQVFADPVTGRVLGLREWGACCFAPIHLMPFLYLAHYTLQLPGTWGVLLMGVVGIVWALDCFVGFALTLPRAGPFWKKWKVAWRVKRGAGNFRVNLDLHRAGGLWLWIVLLMIATSGVAMNLPDQVFRPVLSVFSTLKPSLNDIAVQNLKAGQSPQTLSYDDAIARARREAARHGWHITPRSVFSYAEYGAYGVGFTRAGENGETGLGPSYYYFDGRNGALIDSDIMGQGSAGDVYAQAQYQLHSGRILGLPGRIFICLAGLAVTMLSLTGIYIWARKKWRHNLRSRGRIWGVAVADCAAAKRLSAAE